MGLKSSIIKIREIKRKAIEGTLDEGTYTKILFFLACLFCMIFCIVTTFAPVPIGSMQSSDILPCQGGLTWCICPREAVCATRWEEMLYLAIARGSIYSIYPFILFMFLTKINYLSTKLKRKAFSAYYDFAEQHHIHRIGGRLVEIATWIHVLFHCIRWISRSEMFLIFGHITGRTGFIATIIMPLITWPMSIQAIKKRISFERRKGLHYLSWIWGIALVCHAPATNIMWVMGSAMLIYLFSYFSGWYHGTFLVESTIFRRIDQGTLLSFINPEGFQLQGASYILVMLPWISKHEWHAFSVFPHPGESNVSSICIAAIGDWSKKVHDELHRPTARAAWIAGPYLSPFASAIDYDNIITLATGIGITPALAVLDRLKNTRRVNLIWMCRDPSLISFIVNMIEFPEDAFIFIFYTGKPVLSLPNDVPPNLFVFKGRPMLEYVVISIIHRIETRFLLPEDIVSEGNAFRESGIKAKVFALATRIFDNYDEEEFIAAASVEITSSTKFSQAMQRSPFVQRRNSLFGIIPENKPSLFRTSCERKISGSSNTGTWLNTNISVKHLQTFQSEIDEEAPPQDNRLQENPIDFSVNYEGINKIDVANIDSKTNDEFFEAKSRLTSTTFSPNDTNDKDELEGIVIRKHRASAEILRPDRASAEILRPHRASAEILRRHNSTQLSKRSLLYEAVSLTEDFNLWKLKSKLAKHNTSVRSQLTTDTPDENYLRKEFPKFKSASMIDIRPSMMQEEKIVIAMTRESFKNAVLDFVGNVHFSPEEMDNIFDYIDDDQDGIVTAEHFREVCGEKIIHANIEHRDEEMHKISWVQLSMDSSEFISSNIERERHMFQEQVAWAEKEEKLMKHWQMLYCGGSTPVVKSLKEIQLKYDIDLKVEKFDW